jgi:hypothetical protein
MRIDRRAIPALALLAAVAPGPFTPTASAQTTIAPVNNSTPAPPINFAVEPLPPNLGPGQAGNVGLPTIVVGGIEIKGLYDSSGTWLPANLYRRNNGPPAFSFVDHGLGVCNPAEQALYGLTCLGPNGGGDVNELSNQGRPEAITLKLPVGFRWDRLWISSMDDNEGGPVPERGQLWADEDGVPGGSDAQLIIDFQGGHPVEYVIALDQAYVSSPYLIFVPAGAVPTQKNNDFLVWGAALTEVPRASIGDRVWEDLNANGIQDDGEPGIGDVAVQLFDCSDNLQASTTTTASGFYSFTNLLPGCYYVAFATPSGFLPTPANQGADDAKDSDAVGGKTGNYQLDPGEYDPTVDAGFFRPASIGDFVWVDTNANGIQDAGEAGLAGVVVELYTCADILVATTTTNAGGAYAFNNLTPGDYYVKFNKPAGYTFSPRDAGADDALDSDADPATGRTTCTTLVSGENDTTWDAGVYVFCPPGTGTPGYWKNHPEAWPVASITIGGVTYGKAAAIAVLGTAEAGDKTYTLFRALVAAKLNVLVGNPSSCISATIASADAWMAQYGPAGSGVAAGGSTSPWRTGEPLYKQLDAYNNGKLCAPSRESGSRCAS